MITLREYQTRSINMLYTWFEQHPEGNPCLVLPTGSGKSVIIAELCRDAIQSWPETRILVLSHVKELLEQDADKILAVWPEAPVGIYSASIGMKRLAEPITVAGIQSVRKRAYKTFVRRAFPLETARKKLEQALVKLDHWASINAIAPAAEAGPDAPPQESYLASTFGAALELTREGKMELRQAEAFAPLFVRARQMQNGGANEPA